MLPPIIGLLGRSRSGKDTIASTILQMNSEFQIIRLSMPLKRAVCCLYDYTMDQVESASKEHIDPRWDKTPRETIQSLTDYMMGYMGRDFFSRKLFQAYDQHLYGSHIIIPDIRYQHDVDEIQRRGGIVIKVERPNNPIQHDFEKHIDDMKGTIVFKNDQGILELQDKIQTYILHQSKRKQHLD